MSLILSTRLNLHDPHVPSQENPTQLATLLASKHAEITAETGSL